MANFFNGAEIISRYTRQQAIEDGVLVNLAEGDTAKLLGDAGIKWPVAMTSTAWMATVGLGGKWVAHPTEGGAEQLELPAGQDVMGRTWDVLSMLRFAIKGQRGPSTAIRFDVRVWDGKRIRVVRLKSLSGPGDAGEPVITIMLPDED
jgi:hypothetical protein